MRTEVIYRQIEKWLDDNKSLNINGPCDLVPHAHRFISDLRELIPAETRAFWQSMNCAQDRFVIREVPHERGICLQCRKPHMTFTKSKVLLKNKKPVLTLFGRLPRTKLHCDACGTEFSRGLPHYKCMTPTEASADSFPETFECPGAMCSRCYLSNHP